MRQIWYRRLETGWYTHQIKGNFALSCFCLIDAKKVLDCFCERKFSSLAHSSYIILTRLNFLFYLSNNKNATTHSCIHIQRKRTQFAFWLHYTCVFVALKFNILFIFFCSCTETLNAEERKSLQDIDIFQIRPAL